MNFKFVLTFAVVAVGIHGEEVASGCNDRCADFLKQDGANFIDACQRGCRLYQLSNLRPIFRDLLFFTGQDDPLKKCSTDCKSAYDTNERKVNACQSGCQFRGEEESKKDPLNFGDGGFSVSFGTLPGMDDISGIFNKLHSDFLEQGRKLQEKFGAFGNEVKEKVDDANDQMSEVVKAGSIGSVFSQLHESVKKMMAGLMGASPLVKHTGDGDVLSDSHGGGGELTVIKSGPGYHEEKRYHIGPNADIGKILESSSMDDMLQHRNPMEKFMDGSQVEVFEPVKASGGDENKLLVNMINAISKEVGNSFASKDKVEDAALLDGPKLPETGIRSRHFMLGFDNPFEPDSKEFDLKKLLIVEDNRLCYRDSSSMSWSDWLSCLHVRMGLPNWLMAASVAMGVLFTLWICLMIPSNAPKQKVRKQTNVGTKEVEASKVAVVTVSTKGLLDLPPSYDDVTKDEKVVVNLEPVHGTKPKIVDDDDEITEPLPHGKEDQNQSVV